jgi:hypothetical protein
MGIFRNKITNKFEQGEIATLREDSDYEIVRISEILKDVEEGLDGNVIEVDFENRCLRATETIKEDVRLVTNKKSEKTTKVRKKSVRKTKKQTCNDNDIA